MSQLTVARKNGKSTITPIENWLKTPVREFFSGINWDMHSVEVQEIKRAVQQGSREPLALTLKVSQFFNCIPWDAEPAASPGASEELNAPSSVPASTDLTLEDFSDLF